MALQLPRRGAGGSGRQAVSLPGTENVQQVGIQRDPGLSVPQGAFGPELGDDVGAGLVEVADKFAKAQRRVQNRERSVRASRLFGDFERFAVDAVRRAPDELDLTDETASLSVIDSIDQKMQETLQAFGDDSDPDFLDMRANFENLLRSTRNQQADQLAVQSVTAGRQLAEDVLRNRVTDRAAAVKKDPSQIGGHILGLQQDMNLLKGAFDSNDERDRYAEGVSQLAESALTSFLSRGDFGMAEDLVSDPDVRRALGASRADELEARILQVRRSGQDPIILGEGEIAYDQRGNEIARGPQKPRKTVALGPHDRLVDANSGDTLVEPSQSAARSDLLDDAGGVKREVSAEIRRQTTQLLGGDYNPETGKIGGLDEKFATAAQNLSADVEAILESGEENSVSQAVALAVSRTDLPERLGWAEITDKSLEAINTQAPDGDPDVSTAVQTLEANKENLISLEDAAGVAPAVIELIQNNVLGQLDPGLVDTDVVEARRKIALLENDFIVAFHRSPRLPVWEQMRMSKIFHAPGALDSPEAVRAQLRLLENMSTAAINDKRRMMDAPLPNEEKKNLFADIQTLATFRKKVREFDIDPLIVPIKTVADVNKASPEQIEAFMDRASDDDLQALPDDVKKALLGKASGEETQEEIPTLTTPDEVRNLAPGTQFYWTTPEGEKQLRVRGQ